VTFENFMTPALRAAKMLSVTALPRMARS